MSCAEYVVVVAWASLTGYGVKTAGNQQTHKQQGNGRQRMSPLLRKCLHFLVPNSVVRVRRMQLLEILSFVEEQSSKAYFRK